MLDVRTIAHLLGGDVVGRDRVAAPGPGHSRHDRSLSVKVAPGAPDGLLVHTFSPTSSWQECRDYVLDKLGIRRETSRPNVSYRKPNGRWRNAEHNITSDNRFQNGAEATSSKSPNADGNRKHALRLWREASDPSGTAVETYLASRGLTLPEGAAGEVIRFHPRCPFGGEHHPCMVALYRDIHTNEPKAIHRTALTADGRKIDRKALGPIAGCAIKLSADAAVTTGLTVAEGVETTIAGMALNFHPAWALGNAGALAAFPVLPGIECLTILVDNDVAGRVKAIECSRRWTSAERQVFRVLPIDRNADLADVVRERVTA
jgi:hypothetical protein